MTSAQSLSRSRETTRISLIGTTVVIALSSVIFVALHWRGVPLSPDGWSYWQAAVSLANGSGYRDFSGNPLTAWPPLYSLYLSLWVRLLGATGIALVVANGVLIVCQSVLWFHTVRTIWSAEPGDRRPSVTLVVALYVALYVPLTLQAAHAANLGLLCASLMILATWKTSNQSGKPNDWRWLATCIVAAILALLAHNVNLALVTGCATALLITRHSSTRDFASAAGMLIVPIAAWLVVRWYLGQLGSHPVGIGIANFTAMQYALQVAFVVGNLIVPSSFGAPYLVSGLLLVWCCWSVSASANDQPAAAVRFVASVVLISSGLMLLLFSLTSVADPIGQRFVGWIPILIVPLVFIRAARLPTIFFLITVALIVTPNIHRFVIFSAVHADQRPQQQIGVLFPIGALISPNYTSGRPLQSERGLLIAPP